MALFYNDLEQKQSSVSLNVIYTWEETRRKRPKKAYLEPRGHHFEIPISERQGETALRPASSLCHSSALPSEPQCSASSQILRRGEDGADAAQTTFRTKTLGLDVDSLGSSELGRKTWTGFTVGSQV